MRLGLIARADNTGLGIQTWEFFRHMPVAKAMIVDISKYNSNKQYYERYTEPEIALLHYVRGFPDDLQVRAFLKDLDVVFIAEAAYNPNLYNIAREMGVKTAVQYNYEFMDWLVNPAYPKPDMLIAPSRWHYEEVQKYCDENHIQHIYLHCPVDRERVKFSLRTLARVFLHNAGRSAAYDRNGTETVIEAARLLKTDAKILIRFQGEQGLAHQATRSLDSYRELADGIPAANLAFEIHETENYWDNYADGEVMILPRRYGGNCLPLNEALGAGMPVIMPDIDPNNKWLPTHWLLPAERIGEFTPRTRVDIYGVNPASLAAKIDEMYNYTTSEMQLESHLADACADQIDWEKMRDMYLEALGDLCNL